MECFNCGSKRLKYDAERDAYVCLDCHHEFVKQYFFISHSHLDIEKVRIVRNIVEETFFYEPILFFLKCLSEDAEINDLIRREIDERVWFIYCRSENAERSKYVQQELEYIHSLIQSGRNKKLLTVDLDRFEIWDEHCYDDIRTQIAYQIKKTKIFLSYAYGDEPLARQLRDRLTSEGYTVWSGERGKMWADNVFGGLVGISHRDGIFMPLFTENNACEAGAELARADETGALILPVVERGALCALSPALSERTFCILEQGDVESSVERLVAFIGKM